jgi:hypothetical protein
MDCKFLKSPIADDISPPRFKLDKFLHKNEKKKTLELNYTYKKLLVMRE